MTVVYNEDTQTVYAYILGDIIMLEKTIDDKSKLDGCTLERDSYLVSIYLNESIRSYFATLFYIDGDKVEIGEADCRDVYVEFESNNDDYDYDEDVQLDEEEEEEPEEHPF